jgi:hypothetical protein
MDYTQGERAISHHAGPVRVGGGARDNKFLVTHPMTDQRTH